MMRHRIVAASGLAFFVALALVLAIPHETFPAREARGIDSLPPSSDVQAFFAKNYVMQQAQTFLHILAAGLFLIFAAVLTKALAEGEQGGLGSRVALAAAIVVTAVIVVAMGWVSAIVEQHQNIDGRTLLFLYDAGWSLHFKINYIVPLFLGGASWAMLRGASAPRWIAWTGLAFAALTLLTTLGNLKQSLYFLQFPAFFLLMLWVPAVAVLAAMGRIGARVAPAPAPRPTPVQSRPGPFPPR